MLFNQAEFEHIIEENELKKGLRLFHSDKVELLNERSNNFFQFLIHSKIAAEISLQINAGKIIDYKCSCEQKNYCNHLAAAIFYLQKDKLEIAKPIKKKANIKRAKKNSFQEALHKIKQIVKPYNELTKLSNQQINQLNKKLEFEKQSAVFFNTEFYFCLAVLSELSKLTGYKIAEENNIKFFEDSKKSLMKFLKGKLNVAEQEAVVLAALNSLRSQINFRTGIFSILIPYAAVFIKSKDDFIALKTQLKKRKTNKSHLERIDRKLIAELQISVMQAKFENKAYSLKNYELTVELPIALAELEFCKNKVDKAFKTLLEHAEIIKKNNFALYIDLVTVIILFAKNNNNNSVEIEYLKEKFLYSYYVDDNDLKRFYEMQRNKNLNAITDMLLKELKEKSRDFTFEKITIVLLHENRLTELVEEIKKEKNKFRLLNQIAGKIPFDNDFSKLYVKHFAQAITEAKFPYFQQEVFKLADLFMNDLPAEIRKKLIGALKEKLPYEKYIQTYISKTYNY